MSWGTKPFSGATFFTDVRAQMKLDRGMFAGRDGPFRYIVMDAKFYRFDVFLRPVSKTFTAGAQELQAADLSMRVISNGSHTSRLAGKGTPGPHDWQGEIVQEHTATDGSPTLDFSRHLYFAQWDGIGQDSYWVQRGPPSEVTSPTTLRNAIGRLIPLVTNGVPFGTEEIRDGSGKLTQKFSPAVAEWTHKGEFTGKSIVGIHRAADVVFVLMQENFATSNALLIPALIARLQGMGVDEAVMGDGSTSIALIVDGATELSPRSGKNDNITTGFAFRLQKFRSTTNAATLRANITSSHPQFPPNFTSLGVVATLQQKFGGVVLTLADFGDSAGADSTAIAAALGVTLPLTLEASTSRMRGATTFLGGNDLRASLVLLGTVTAPFKVTGTLTIDSPQGAAGFDIDWPLEAVDDK